MSPEPGDAAAVPPSAGLQETLRAANAARAQGRWRDARDLCEEVLRRMPHCFDAIHLLGVVAVQAGSPAAAVPLFDRAIALDPRHAAVRCNRGAALQNLGHWDEALASFDAAIAIRADYALAHANRGTVLTALGRPHDALASFEHALALAPDFPEAYVGRGNAFKELNQLQPALESYDRAVALRADFAEAHFNRAIVLLLLGDLEAGWQAYEWRWRKPGGSAGKPRRDLPQPLWLGAESLEAKTLLIHCEKGLGDTLQFCRYVRLAAERRARVILQVQAPLVELLSGLDGAAQVLSEESSPSGFDYHCPLLSLPLAFGTRLENIPAPARYLSGDAGRSAEWRRRLGDTAPRIGLVWRGDPTNPDDRNRSVALQDMLPHLSPGARYFSLQKALTEAERRAFESNPDLSIAAAELSFADAAAVCECLDLVISVDTSIAHLSAALGRPTWILLPFSPDCRWLLGRDDSPWYPSVKLYRQARSGDWCDVLARVGADLTQAFPRGEGVSALRPPPG